ncbi:MAG: glycoside hydrolase family 3 protein [Bacteroidia bacterium]|nr:glycoside hydrolase family 3 protein [Bacteroidia bacterium]
MRYLIGLRTSIIPLLIIGVVSCGPKFTEEVMEDHSLVKNENGSVLGYSPNSGVQLLTKDNYAFKDLNKNGDLDPYEDWRLSAEERAVDLASKMSIEQIAGLMLYSAHQSIPARSQGYFAGTYKGEPYMEGETDPSQLTDQQKKFIAEDNLRHVLITTVKSPEVAAQWNNNMQAYCESLGLGIPANNSSDPRHGTISRMEYDAAAGGEISMWPSSVGMAATFDPGLVKSFGDIASREYRALGITTALSPQIDIATEPRWARFSGTFGEDPKLAAEMARAYVDGFQSTQGGWGVKSVNAMVKHWPGGGSGEAGRDAHYGAGKYAVYPGNNFDEHLEPFINGAFNLESDTGSASAVMPYYTISWKQDTKNGENVGNAYNEYIIKDMLRGTYGYDGVICTDWGVTRDHNVMDSFMDGKPWGIEGLTEAKRHYKALMVGIDQFGGNNDMQPILEAYQMGIEEMGEDKIRARMERSAVRLLRNIFRVGIFENPYLSPSETSITVGQPDYMRAGFEAQLKSVVLLKNMDSKLPLKEKTKVYVPKRYVPASRNFLGMEIPESNDYPVNIELVKKYFEVTDTPEEAEVALVFIESPSSGSGYNKTDVEKGGNGYFPISLQYGDYTAVDARETSIAGGDPLEDFTNRSYKNKSVETSNKTDATLVAETKAAMGDKPVVIAIGTTNPFVIAEIEQQSDAILLGFGVQDQVFLNLITGKTEPSGLLPFQMPADMTTVEQQFEDVPRDMKPYLDSEGNTYDFAFGLNWSGVISDARVERYR